MTTMADPAAVLGSTEIEILRFLGDRSPLSVGEVADHFARTSGQARTTILTIMERLRTKGHLRRKRAGGTFQYSPVVAKDDLFRGLVKSFVDTTLAGSVSPFVAYLSEGGPVSEEDLEQLKQLVRDLEQTRKGARK
ncbi:BlaI/MecI/CopY family transcriptional regulator [soil metagenome]